MTVYDGGNARGFAESWDLLGFPVGCLAHFVQSAPGKDGDARQPDRENFIQTGPIRWASRARILILYHPAPDWQLCPT